MPEPEVVDQFATMGLPEVKTAVKDLNEQLGQIMAPAKDTETGSVDFGKVKGEDAKKAFDINQKMGQAQTRLEQLLTLQGAVDQAKRLEEFMRTPAGSLTIAPAPSPSTPSLGKAFVGSAQYRSFVEQKVKGSEVEFDAALRAEAGGRKAVLGTDDTLVDVDDLFPVESTRSGVIVPTLYQENNVAPLIPTIATSQHVIKYLQETVNATGSAETAEGALTPEASVEWAEVTAPIVKIAVSHPITEELGADEPAMRGIVDQRLRLFQNNREDFSILQGDGVGPNMTGLLNTAGIQNLNESIAGAPTAQDFLELIHNAKTLIFGAFQMPTDVVMTAASWEVLRLAKDGNLNYLLGPPSDSGVARAWGLPVTVNQNMDERAAAGTVPVLVGDFRQGATIFRRQEVSLSITDSHADEFLRGILRVRLVSRLGLVVWRPTGFVTITRTA